MFTHYNETHNLISCYEEVFSLMYINKCIFIVCVGDGFRPFNIYLQGFVTEITRISTLYVFYIILTLIN